MSCSKTQHNSFNETWFPDPSILIQASYNWATTNCRNEVKSSDQTTVNELLISVCIVELWHFVIKLSNNNLQTFAFKIDRELKQKMYIHI